MNEYSDIINHPHHVSEIHPPMSMEKRAAQFAPFAAVSGHRESVNEAARYTEARAELTDERIADLNRKLLLIRQPGNEEAEVTVTYFEDDLYKAGGKYKEIRGCIIKIDELKHRITMDNGMVIHMDHIQEIKGNIFDWE